MSKPKNKVKFGLKNVHYAIQTIAEDGTITFATPVRIPGAVNLNLAPQGETSTFYADNVAYYVSNSNMGYQGDLEIAMIPDSFATDVLKETLTDTDKVMVEYSTVETAAFALLFEFTGDIHAVRHVLYNCTAARPSVTGSTSNNNKEPKTDTLPLTAAPMADGMVKAHTIADTTDTVCSGWYTSVWQPQEAA